MHYLPYFFCHFDYTDLRKYVEVFPQNNQNGSTADLVGIQ